MSNAVKDASNGLNEVVMCMSQSISCNSTEIQLTENISATGYVISKEYDPFDTAGLRQSFSEK